MLNSSLKKNKQNKPEDKQQEEYSFPVEIAFDYHLSNTITVAMAKWQNTTLHTLVKKLWER